MRRVSCVLIAFAAFVPSLARAQNFPDIPDNHWLHLNLSPRALALSNILADAGLIERRSSRASTGHYFYSQGSVLFQELEYQMLLLRVYLGVVPKSDDEFGGEWLAGWQRQLPVGDALFGELLGDRYKAADGKSEMKETIRVIKSRFAERGTPVDEHRFEPFSDLVPCHWANHAIIRMRERGILNGYPDNTFRG